ncbi:MAG: VPLPA-CTERM sorting domain-containing protein [Pseudomonadota bacterium]
MAAAALALSAVISPASAATLDFTFSFLNSENGSGTATVTGILRGLEDNATSAATSLEVLSNDDGFGIGSYDIANAVLNEFTVNDGEIEFARFVAFGSFAEAPFVTDSTFEFNFSNFSSLIQGGLNQDLFEVSGGPSSVVTFTPVAAVPLPAGGVLLISGLVGLAALRRRPVNEA